MTEAEQIKMLEEQRKEWDGIVRALKQERAIIDNQIQHFQSFADNCTREIDRIQQGQLLIDEVGE